MAFVPATVKLIGSPLAMTGSVFDVDTVQRNPLGLRVYDDKGGEYIYLKGVAACAQSVAVTFDLNFQSVVLVADAYGPVAWALGAVLAANYGWFCTISPLGGFTGKSDTVAGAAQMFIDGTAGRVDDAVVTGDMVLNCVSTAADASNLCVLQFVRPFVTNSLG